MVVPHETRLGRASGRPTETTDATTPSVNRPVVHVAGDVMTRDPDRVACTDTLAEVADRMRSLLVAFLPVCEDNGDLRGIITLRDLQRVIRGGHPTAATASSLLAAEPSVTIGVNDPVDHVPDLMAKLRMWLLPVLDGRRLVGVIHYAIVPRHLCPRAPGYHHTPTAP